MASCFGLASLAALILFKMGGHRVREENKDDGERWIHSGLSTCFS